jgi:hypothetical protein
MSKLLDAITINGSVKAWSLTFYPPAVIVVVFGIPLLGILTLLALWSMWGYEVVRLRDESRERWSEAGCRAGYVLA